MYQISIGEQLSSCVCSLNDSIFKNFILSYMDPEILNTNWGGEGDRKGKGEKEGKETRGGKRGKAMFYCSSFYCPG